MKVIPALAGLPLLMVQLSFNLKAGTTPAHLPGRAPPAEISASGYTSAPAWWRSLLVLAFPSTGPVCGLSFGFRSKRSQQHQSSRPQRLINPARGPSCSGVGGSAIPADRPNLLAQRGWANISGVARVLSHTATGKKTQFTSTQLPLLLFSSPLIGLGWQTCTKKAPLAASITTGLPWR